MHTSARTSHAARALLLGFLTLSLAGCAQLRASSTGKDIDLPAAYTYQAEAALPQATDEDWLKGFGADEIIALAEEGSNSNLDLEAGLANLAAARASLVTAQAGLFPSVSASASASASSTDDYDDVSRSGRVSASYQLDLFGANRAAARASRETLAARVFDQKALALTVRSDIISSYVSVLALRSQLESAQTDLEIATRIYELVTDKYTAGAVSGFDMESQKVSLAASRARLPQLEQQLISAETALAILLGRSPQGYEAPQGDLMTLTPPALDAGLPSDLLLRRPDLLAAEARLRAANADIDAARAAFFPSIDLSAGISSVLESGIDPVGTLSASVAQALFGGGRLIAQSRRAKAERDALVASYRKAVFNALRDVDLALKAADVAALREDQYHLASAASERALELAEIRYRSGADDLTSLLSAQANALSAKDNLTAAHQARLQAALDLYVATGGGW